jgi:CBS domain-containing protein
MRGYLDLHGAASLTTASAMAVGSERLELLHQWADSTPRRYYWRRSAQFPNVSGSKGTKRAMSQADEKLAAIADQLLKGSSPPKESLRSLLLWFDAERRGYRVVRRIRNALRRHGLTTVPDFEEAYIDAELCIVKRAPQAQRPDAIPNGIPDDSAPDPGYRLSRLSSANRRPVAVAPDATLQQVITVMMSNDFSQVPVMNGPRDVKGIVSWKSIGTRLALRQECARARDCMEDAHILPLSESLFSAIATIAAHDHVLIQAADKTICGIITATDLNDQFRLLAEPFLLVGEIENGVRRLLHGKFTTTELHSVKTPAEAGRDIESAADLNFGDYIRLVEQDVYWTRLALQIDRATFVSHLNRVREIRNDVVHFDPDGLDDSDLKFLRDTARFLKRLRDVGAA